MLREWDFKREHLANLTFPRSELQNWENPMEKRLVKLCAIKMKYTVYITREIRTIINTP